MKTKFDFPYEFDSYTFDGNVSIIDEKEMVEFSVRTHLLLLLPASYLEHSIWTHFHGVFANAEPQKHTK